MRNTHKIVVGKPEGKKPLKKPRRRWEDNIKIDIREIGSKSVDRNHRGRDRYRWWAVVSMAMNIRISGVTSNERACGKNCVMGPPAHIFFISRTHFRQLPGQWPSTDLGLLAEFSLSVPVGLQRIFYTP
jgi:hypothetical protein